MARQSKRFQLNKGDALNIAKVFAWSAGSAIVTVAISLIQDIDAGQWAILLPVVNTGLVALKKLLEDKGKLVK